MGTIALVKRLASFERVLGFLSGLDRTFTRVQRALQGSIRGFTHKVVED